MNQVIIGLGSNIRPLYNIEKAEALLAQRYTITAKSSRLTTKPVGFTQQADFLNSVVQITTPEGLEQVKAHLKEIEKQLGRQRSANKFSPRSIDLDIIVFNKNIIDKDFYSRDFLQKLVFTIRPDLLSVKQPPKGKSRNSTAT